jgi:tRNA-specific 2-thiouridylase
MFDGYERGFTPNPDVLCNREIKFDSFLKHALSLGAEYVATGHYCRKDTVTEADGQTTYRLLAGLDNNKDQSYFLCQLTQEQLRYALFPIGDLTKPEVRRIAKEAGLPSAEKKDSQGICFVGKVDLPVFLQQKLKPKEGKVIEIFRDYYDGLKEPETIEELAAPTVYSEQDGKLAGRHDGAQFYTIGQRHGLNIGGHKNPLFVIATDVADNVIYVGEGQDHPGLYRRGLRIEPRDIHWVRPSLALAEGEERDCLVRIRYRQPLQKARLICRGDGLYIIFEKPQRGVTAGQFAAWYDNEGELQGSGVINR